MHPLNPSREEAAQAQEAATKEAAAAAAKEAAEKEADEKKEVPTETTGGSGPPEAGAGTGTVPQQQTPAISDEKQQPAPQGPPKEGGQEMAPKTDEDPKKGGTGTEVKGVGAAPVVGDSKRSSG